MIRALAKGVGLAVFGLGSPGERLYRHITRDVFDTQKSHIIKLHRVWPGTMAQIRKAYGRSLNKRTIFIHELGWTPFWPCMNYLVSGSGGVLINTDFLGSTMLLRHVIFAINQSLDLARHAPSNIKIPQKRMDELDSLRWCQDLDEFLHRTNTKYIQGCSPAELTLSDESVDIIYSGGQLEHYPPELLSLWLDEAFRVLRPGGLLAPVLDHRDHLYHFDHKIPFLNHYRYPDFLYRLTHHSKLLYHNRMLPEEVTALFVSRGFSLRKLRRLVLPDNVWIDDGDKLLGKPGLGREFLYERFSNISEADLHTAAGHYIFEKPR